MPKMTAEYMTARKQQIVQAAKKCFIDKGYHQATMQDILAEAGLSAGAVYNHFPSKEKIVEYLIEQSVHDAHSTYEANKAAKSARPLRRFFEKYIMGMFRNRRILREAILNVDGVAAGARNKNLGKLIRRDFDNGVLQIAHTVKDGQGSGEISPELDAERVGQVVTALSLGMLCMRLVDRDLDTDAINDTFWAIAEGKLTGPVFRAGPE